LTSQEIIDKVESFLDHIEMQKERDREEFEAIRAGVIDEILAAEFAENTIDEDGDQDVQTNAFTIQDNSPFTSNTEKELGQVVEVNQARSDLLHAIQNGKRLKRTMTNDKSEPENVGKVLHKHIAPRAFTRGHRQLMQSIDGKVGQIKLNKVKINDRSAPYIPKDIEIYFYSGPNHERPQQSISKQPEGYFILYTCVKKNFPFSTDFVLTLASSFDLTHF